MRQGARILIVEDDPDSGECLRRLLELLAHDVRVVRDGPQAIAVALRWQPDYILLDLGLPGMDGYQVASRLRAEESCRETVIIAVTGYGRPEDRQLCRDAGIDHHLLKPVDLDRLLSVLSRQHTLADGGERRSDEPRAEAPGTSDTSRFPDERIPQLIPAGPPGLLASETAPGSPSIAITVTKAADGDSSRSPPWSDAIRAGPARPGGPRPEPSSIVALKQYVEITHDLGLHLRAANKFVRLARQFRADVRVTCDGRQVNGQSILDLMTLAAPCGAFLELEADGPDAAEALAALAALISRRFDELNG